jgi:hypothetical protein
VYAGKVPELRCGILRAIDMDALGVMRENGRAQTLRRSIRSIGLTRIVSRVIPDSLASRRAL